MLVIGQKNEPANKLGNRISNYSATYKENREFLLYVPESCTDSLQPKNEIPVLVVLDGEDLFLTAVALQQQLAEYAYYPILPEMIVIGIVHKNREEELFPKALNDTLSQMKRKAGKFLDYLEEELLPAIDSIRGSRGPRILFGHSLGGLIGVHTINAKPNLFNAYLLTDPAYTISIQQMNPSQVSITSQFQLKYSLENSRITTIRRDTRYYPNESHFTIPGIGLRDGLLSYFRNYRCPYFEWMDEDSLGADELGNAVRVHYEKISEML